MDRFQDHGHGSPMIDGSWRWSCSASEEGLPSVQTTKYLATLRSMKRRSVAWVVPGIVAMVMRRGPPSGDSATAEVMALLPSPVQTVLASACPLPA